MKKGTISNITSNQIECNFGVETICMYPGKQACIAINNIRQYLNNLDIIIKKRSCIAGNIKCKKFCKYYIMELDQLNEKMFDMMNIRRKYTGDYTTMILINQHVYQEVMYHFGTKQIGYIEKCPMFILDKARKMLNGKSDEWIYELSDQIEEKDEYLDYNNAWNSFSLGDFKQAAIYIDKYINVNKDDKDALYLKQSLPLPGDSLREGFGTNK